GVLDHVARGARRADPADDAQDQVLGGDAPPQLAGDVDLKGLGAGLPQALGGQDALHLAGADAEGQSAEGPMRRRVAVAADDGHARLGEALLRADDVRDALVGAVQVVKGNAKLLAVAGEGFHLLRGDRIRDGQRPVRGGDVVVYGRHRQVGPAHPAPGQPQPLEGLGRRHLVEEVKVDVKQGGTARLLHHDVALPDLLVHRFRLHGAHLGGFTRLLPKSYIYSYNYASFNSKKQALMRTPGARPPGSGRDGGLRDKHGGARDAALSRRIPSLYPALQRRKVLGEPRGLGRL